jgi:hypothetical protein
LADRSPVSVPSFEKGKPAFFVFVAGLPKVFLFVQMLPMNTLEDCRK